MPISVVSNRKYQGGKAIPVYLADSDKVEGGAAVPVYAVDGSDGVLGGNAVPVYIMDDDHKIDGGIAIPVYDISGNMLSEESDSSYLLRDDFNNTLTSGSVNGTLATPGPGTRRVIDTNPFMQIDSRGQLTLTSIPANNWRDPDIYYTPESLIRAASFHFTPNGSTTPSMPVA